MDTAADSRDQYSFVVPIYRDADLAENFCSEFQKVFRDYLGCQDIADAAELIFVNDGSGDDSFKTLIGLASRYTFLKLIDLSRNFGQHLAVSCGYAHARGKYVGMLNVDMEDPPSQIIVVLNHLKAHDYDIVIGLRANKRSNLLQHITSVSFNYVLNKLTGYNEPLNVATLRVMNRRFVDAYNSLTEKSRYIPGLESWLGFNHGYIAIENEAGKKAGSSYGFRARVLMAVDSIVSFSDLPLKMVSLFGGLVALVGFFLTILLIISQLYFIDYQPGFTSTLSTIVFLAGIQIVVTGLSGIYIGRILKEVQNRPMYIVREIFSP